MFIDGQDKEPTDIESGVLIIGADPVGCFVENRLGKQRMPVTIIEKGATIPYSPLTVGDYRATQVAFKNAGLYNLVRREEFKTAGLCWRSRSVENSTGGKTYGDNIVTQPLCAPGDTADFPYPSGLLSLRKSEFTKLLLRQALSTGNTTFYFSTTLEEIEHGGQSVTAVARNILANVVSQVNGSYLVGADGGKSKTRKILGIPCLGHTRTEQFILTNVVLLNQVDTTYRTCYVMDMDEELLKEVKIKKFHEQVMAWSSPLDMGIKQRTVYRTHQRLVPTMRRRRCVLKGGLAHMNNPYGAMGLNTELLDADALSEALIMILKESKSGSLLTLCFDERLEGFQSFVGLTTTANKIRLHLLCSREAVNDDHCFREI